MSLTQERLVELLTEFSFERKQVTLASGKTSDFFVDCKQTALTAEGHALLGELMFQALKAFANVDAVAGVELGGCSLASAVALVSFQKGAPLSAFYVRKARKDHGSKRMVEGDKHLRPAMDIVLLEDVVTTGGSTLKAVEQLKAAGANPCGVVAIVDRLEGGADAIKAAGLPFVSLTTRHDFIPPES